MKANIMKLKFPASFSALTADEMVNAYGGSARDIFIGTITGLASAAEDVIGSVRRGEISPLDALRSSFVYLAGNIVGSIIWMIA